MKSILWSFVAISLFATSCSLTKSNSIENVAKAYLDAINKGDYTKAKEYGTEATGKTLDMMSTITGAFTDTINARTGIPKIELIGKPTMDGENKAIVQYRTSNNPDIHELTLVKQDGQWKAEFTKDPSAMPMPTDETPSANPDEAMEDSTLIDKAKEMINAK